MNQRDHRSTPSHWRTVRLNEIADVRLGRQRSPDRATGPNMVPYLRAANVTWSGLALDDVKEMDFTPAEQVTYRLEPGDILLSEASGSASEVGKAAIYRGERAPCFFQNTLIRVRPPAPLARFLHLHFVTDALTGAFAKASRGVGIHHLGAQTLEQWEVVLPPVEEQQRIVDAVDSQLSRLAAAIESLESAERKLKAYRASVLKAAVEGRLVPTEAELARKEGRSYETAVVLLERILKERRRRWEIGELAKMKAAGRVPKDSRWKAKYSEPEPPDVDGLSSLPEGWCWTSLGQAFQITVGATPSRSVPEYWGGPIPWVSSGEVAFCRISQTAETITAAGLRHSSTKMNPKGSVLIGMIGEGKTRGQTAILDIDACGNQNAAAIWVSETEVVPEFVHYYLMGQYERTRRRGSGNNQPALNKSRVSEIPLPLPPVAEQRRIVEALDLLLSLASHTDAAIELEGRRLSRLRQSILRSAFEGRLVDQDLNDEPADLLLARIRDELAPPALAKPKAKRLRRLRAAS